MGGAGDPRVCGCWQPGLPAPRPATEGTSYSFILGDSARPQSPGSLSQGAGAGGGASVPARSPSTPSRAPRGRPWGWQLGLDRRSAPQTRRLLWVPSSQPLSCWSQAPCSMPSLCFPGQAGRAGAVQPWERNDTDPLSRPAPRSAQPLPQSLRASWRAGPGPAALWADQDSAPPSQGPQLGRCRRGPGGSGALGSPHLLLALRAPRISGTEGSFLCHVPLLLSSRLPLGPRQGASSEACSLIRTAPI